MSRLLRCAAFAAVFCYVSAGIHYLKLTNDTRDSILLNEFGYLSGGYFSVNFTHFSYQDPFEQVRVNSLPTKLGFALSRGSNFNEWLGKYADTCPFSCPESQDLLCHSLKKPGSSMDTVLFALDFHSNSVRLDRIGSGDLEAILICHENKCFDTLSAEELAEQKPKSRTKRRRLHRLIQQRRTEDQNKTIVAADVSAVFGQTEDIRRGASVTRGAQTRRLLNYIPMVRSLSSSNATIYSAKFTVKFDEPRFEGYYYFRYVNCFNFQREFVKRVKTSVELGMVMRNKESFLSAGHIQFPQLYFGLSALFFCAAIAWVHLLKSTSKDEVYRIHWLMALLVFLKSFALLFHGVNFYFISIEGHREEMWAIFYYITNLLKGALLFGVIILIGTGYTFFKNYLTERERRLFMAVIPLQVLANVALVVLDEAEEGQQNYRFYKQMFIFVDLLCCIAVIFPVVWSIQHLQEASKTDGKALLAVSKLKIFRQFYLAVVAYIYLTRVIKFVIAFTTPFRYSWSTTLVVELSAFLFYVLTAYSFAPTANNPYIRVAQTDDDQQEGTGLEGLLEMANVRRLKHAKKEPNGYWASSSSEDDAAAAAALANQSATTTDGSAAVDIY